MLSGGITISDRTFEYEENANKALNDIVFEITRNGEETIIYLDAIKSEKEGNYSFSFNMPLEYRSGDDYSLTVYEYGNEKVTSPITYINENEKAMAINAINEETESVESIIKNSSFFFMDREVAKIADYAGAAELIENYVAENALTDENAYEVINKAAYISVIKAGLIENVFDYSSELCMDESSIADFFEKSYVGETVQINTTNRLKGSNAVSFEEFNNELGEAFVLSVVEKPDGLDNLIEVLNAFSDEIDITKNASDSVYKAIQNKTYSDYDALKTAFNKAKKENSGDGSSGGGSGGGGGKAPSKSDTPKVDTTVIGAEEDDDLKPLIINIFEDIDDNYWGKTAVISLAELGIVNGRGDGCFHPNDNITREEFVKIVVTALKYENKSAEAVFADVDKSEWYYPYISAAAESGIIKGYEDGRFGIGENITRQDMCVILHRAAVLAGYMLVPCENSDFIDIENASDYAKENINVLGAENIVNGYDNGEFKPLNNSTRVECAAMVYNILNLFNKF